MSDFYDEPMNVDKGSAADSESAATTAMVLEIVMGFLGVLGVGHVYTGRIGLGIGLAIGWWVYLAIAGGISLFSGGFGACLFIPLSIGFLVFSGMKARDYARAQAIPGNWGPTAAVAAVGCLIILVIIPVSTIAILTLLGPTIGNVFSDIVRELGTPTP